MKANSKTITWVIFLGLLAFTIAYLAGSDSPSLGDQIAGEFTQIENGSWEGSGIGGR